MNISVHIENFKQEMKRRTENHEWIVGDLFTTNFWGNYEICLIRKISDEYIFFIRLESNRSLSKVDKDYCEASMGHELFTKIKKSFIHHSEWYYDYTIQPLPAPPKQQ